MKEIKLLVTEKYEIEYRDEIRFLAHLESSDYQFSAAKNKKNFFRLNTPVQS